MDKVYVDDRLSGLLERNIASATRDGRIRPGQGSYEPDICLDDFSVEEGGRVDTSLGPAFFTWDEDKRRLVCEILIQPLGGRALIGASNRVQVREYANREEYSRVKARLFRKDK